MSDASTTFPSPDDIRSPPLGEEARPDGVPSGIERSREFLRSSPMIESWRKGEGDISLSFQLLKELYRIGYKPSRIDRGYSPYQLRVVRSQYKGMNLRFLLLKLVLQLDSLYTDLTGDWFIDLRKVDKISTPDLRKLHRRLIKLILGKNPPRLRPNQLKTFAVRREVERCETVLGLTHRGPEAFSGPARVVDYPRLLIPMSVDDIRAADQFENRQITIIKDRYGEEKFRPGLFIPPGVDRERGPEVRARAIWFRQMVVDQLHNGPPSWTEAHEVLTKLVSEDSFEVYLQGNSIENPFNRNEIWNFPDSYGELVSTNIPMGPGLPGLITLPKWSMENYKEVDSLLLVTDGKGQLAATATADLEVIEDKIISGQSSELDVLYLLASGRSLPEGWSGSDFFRPGQRISSDEYVKIPLHIRNLVNQQTLFQSIERYKPSIGVINAVWLSAFMLLQNIRFFRDPPEEIVREERDHIGHVCNLYLSRLHPALFFREPPGVDDLTDYNPRLWLEQILQWRTEIGA